MNVRLNHRSQYTKVGKIRFRVVSTRNRVYSFTIIFIIVLSICIIFLLLLLLFRTFTYDLYILGIVIFITCTSFSIRTTVNLLLLTPVQVTKWKY
jgi:hypothetical protein